MTLLIAQEIEKMVIASDKTQQLGWEVLLGMGVCTEFSHGRDAFMKSKLKYLAFEVLPLE